MASKQYGLKIFHEPTNRVASEKWFNTELERNNAMAGSTMEPHYIFVAEEREIEPPVVVSDESNAPPNPPDQTPETPNPLLAQVFAEMLEKHSDFAALQDVMLMIAHALKPDWTKIKPAEYCECLYVIAKHAEFVMEARDQALLAKAQPPSEHLM